MSTNAIPQKVVAPPYLDAAKQAEWVANTEKYDWPVYKYPFWFWTTPFEKGEAKTSCAFLSFPKALDLQACAVWNDVSVSGLSLWAKAPVYMEDAQGVSVASDMVIVSPGPNKPANPEEAPPPEENKSGSSTGLYLLLGAAGSALLYWAYKKKRNKR